MITPIGKRLATLLLAATLIGAGCGDDDGGDVRQLGESDGSSASASGSGSAVASGSAEDCHVEGGIDDAEVGEVHASLAEYTIETEETSVAAGAIKFEATNEGEEPHELAIIRADDPEALPTADDGSVDDAALGDDLIGEIEPFATGTECQGTFELGAGTYSLICNIVEEDGESHYAEGMYTTLTVTD